MTLPETPVVIGAFRTGGIGFASGCLQRWCPDMNTWTPSTCPPATDTVKLTRGQTESWAGHTKESGQVRSTIRRCPVYRATRTGKMHQGKRAADTSRRSQHGRLDAPAPAATPAPAPVGSIAEAAGSVNDPAPMQMSPMFRQPDTSKTFQQPAAVPVAVPVAQESLGEAAKRNKQHKACLVLAADNPSITCQ